MKSIIQEASSIAKAIEEGWLKANKPQHFSVKVLEEAEKNFLGLTKKSAKVAILFEEVVVTQARPVQRSSHHAAPQDRHERPHRQERGPRQQQSSGYAESNRQARPSFNESPRNVDRPPRPSEQPQVKKQFEPLWNQAMVERTQQWMHDALTHSGNQHVAYTVEPQKFHLRITLSQPILSDPDKEKQLLASFSALILETLKRTFKTALRGHKIVLTHKRNA